VNTPTPHPLGRAFCGDPVRLSVEGELMSKTADTSHWDTSSPYHDLRSSHAEPQVEQFLLPFFRTYSEKVEGVTVADFACGGGAIAEQVLQQTKDYGINISNLILMDVVSGNIETAQNRVRDNSNGLIVDKFVCNGNDFSNYDGNKVSLLYCWDAMVHFDIIDIVGYMKTLDRVCKGYAFFHHSNFGVVTSDITQNPHWRNFMTKDVFHQICLSSGHSVVSQQVFAWDQEEHDCITILKVG
jgi:ubiquinone/menaquinone biosynthesis C-methylase UbiE